MKTSTDQKGSVNTSSKDRLNDPFFASRLDKMSKVSLSKMMYHNDSIF